MARHAISGDHDIPRWECDFDAIIKDEAGHGLVSRIANISEEGFLAECENVPHPGSVVGVVLPGRGPVRAEVRWAENHRFGATILGN